MSVSNSSPARYKILKRYQDSGLEALSDRSRRPYRHANQLSFHIAALIVRLKEEKPAWGAPKIRHGRYALESPVDILAVESFEGLAA